MAFATTSEMDYKTFIVDAIATYIARDLFVSNFIRGAGLSRCMRHERLTKFVLRNHMSFQYIESSAVSNFVVTQLEDKILASCSDSDAYLLLTAAPIYL